MGAALFPDLVINGELVAQAKIAAEAQNHSAPAGKPGIAWRKAARAVAIRTLLLQTARGRGMIAAPQELAPGRFETEEEALVRALLDDAVVIDAPNEDELRQEYARDPQRFRVPPLWDVSHILIACDPADKTVLAAAEQRARELAAKAVANPKGFARLAEENSDCGSRSSGGALGQIGQGDTVPEFEAALRGLGEGEVTAEPVLSRFGWHVIRLDAVAQGAVLPFDAVRQKISDAMEKARWAAGARHFVETLARDAEISGIDLTAPIQEG